MNRDKTQAHECKNNGCKDDPDQSLDCLWVADVSDHSFKVLGLST